MRSKKTKVAYGILASVLFFVVIALCVGGYSYLSSANKSELLYIGINHDQTRMPEWIIDFYVLNIFGSKEDIEALYTDAGGLLFMYSDNDTITDKQKKYMQHILDRGYDLNRLDCSGNTPLFLAAQNNQPNTIEWLLGLGASPSIRADSNHGECHRSNYMSNQTPLEIAIEMHQRFSEAAMKKGKQVDSKHDYNKVIRLLEKHG